MKGKVLIQIDVTGIKVNSDTKAKVTKIMEKHRMAMMEAIYEETLNNPCFEAGDVKIDTKWKCYSDKEGRS